MQISLKDGSWPNAWDAGPVFFNGKVYLRFRSHGFETMSQPMKQFAHDWYLPCCQCIQTCYHVSVIKRLHLYASFRCKQSTRSYRLGPVRFRPAGVNPFLTDGLWPIPHKMSDQWSPAGHHITVPKPSQRCNKGHVSSWLEVLSE